MPVAGTKIIGPIFVLTVLVGNMVAEDFLWFALQSLTGWRHPDALSRLFKGDFAWHKEWWSMFGIKLPRFYITTTAVVIIVLFLQYLIAQNM